MIRTWLSEHKVALVLGIIVGILAFVPYWYGARAIPGFDGIYHEPVDDQLYYLARAQDVVDGHIFLSNPYIAEYKNSFPLQVWLPDALLAVPLGLLHIPVPIGYILWALVLVSLLFVLTYTVTFELTSSRLWSIGTALLFNLGLNSIQFLRSPSPELNFIFFELLALFSLRYLRTRGRADFICATLTFGSLFYLYPYFWTFWAALLGCFVVLDFLFLKDRLCRPYLFMLVLGFVIGLPYFWSTYEASKLPYYKETLERIGLIFTHFPSGYLIVGVAGVTFIVLATAVLFRRYRFDGRALLLASGVLAAIIVVNQPVITGQNLEFSSHYQLPAFYWSVLVLVAVAAAWVARWPVASKRTAIGLFLAISIVSALYGEMSLVRLMYGISPSDINNQRYAPAFAWLRENSKKDDVVFADDNVSFLIPVYTSDNVYSSGYGLLFFMPNSEVEKRFIINHYRANYTPNYIISNQRALFGAYYIDEYAHTATENHVRRLLHMPQFPNPVIPADVIARVQNEAKTIQSQPFEAVLGSYEINYILWDTNADPSWDLDQYPFLKKEFSENGVEIYSVNLSLAR